ncbi:unnamed protein product [Moneuplotes crassus]|uniref:Uncharacterized protein n=1 Tax=Euplotes crassus TaxID=5936 RepID=A0AAD1XQK3_EUPCR|nr:unnamed protein product [Moneuplotes crassus]
MNSYKNHTLKPPASDSAKEYYSLVNSHAPKKRLNKFNYVLYDSKGNNMSANRSTNRESSLKNSASDLNFTNSQLFPSVENISDKLESLKKFDDETSKMFIDARKKKKKRYKKVVSPKQNFNFDKRVYYNNTERDHQLNQFMKLNKIVGKEFNISNRRARSNLRTKELFTKDWQKTDKKQRLKTQIEMLEQELFK